MPLTSRNLGGVLSDMLVKIGAVGVDPRRAAAVRAVVELVGMPYRHLGRSRRDGGLDCIGIARAAWTAAGVPDLPDPNDYPEQYHKTIGDSRLRDALLAFGPIRGDAISVLPGDLLLFHADRNDGHLGVFVGPHPDGRTGCRWFVHVWELHGGVVVNSLDQRYWARSVRGFVALPRAA